MTFYFLKTVLMTGAVISLTACAASAKVPFTGKKDFGSEVSQVSKDWKKGEEMVAHGEKLIKSGKALQRSGKDEISGGKAREQRFSSRLTIDQRNYDSAVEMTGAATNADEAVAHANKLKALSKTLKTTQDELAKSRKLQKTGVQHVDDGKAKVKKGEKLVREGNIRMVEAERAYQSVTP